MLLPRKGATHHAQSSSGHRNHLLSGLRSASFEDVICLKYVLRNWGLQFASHSCSQGNRTIKSFRFATSCLLMWNFNCKGILYFRQATKPIISSVRLENSEPLRHVVAPGSALSLGFITILLPWASLTDLKPTEPFSELMCFNSLKMYIR